VTVDFSDADEVALNSAFEQGSIDAKYTLIHVVKTLEPMIYGKQHRSENLDR
jgi:manganese transport protein